MEEYIITGNASEAARRAGYSAKSAESTGRENLRKPTIQQAIDAKQAEIRSKRTATPEEVMEFLTAVMRGEIMEQVVVVEGTGEGCSKARLIEKPPSVADRTKAADHILKRFGRPPKLEEKELMAQVEKLKLEAEALKEAKEIAQGQADKVIFEYKREDADAD